MSGDILDDDMVLVKGPRGRHIEVHKTTQAALPEAFPLVEHTETATADGNSVDDKKEPENGD